MPVLIEGKEKKPYPM